jgi:hypothetical protein
VQINGMAATDKVLEAARHMKNSQMPIPEAYMREDGGSPLGCSLKMGVGTFFSRFLLFDDDKPTCTYCVGMYRMCLMLLSSIADEHNLSLESRNAVEITRQECTSNMRNLALPRKKRAKVSTTTLK